MPAETNIKPLIAKDVAFALTGRQPNAVEVKELHQTAYQQLVDLLHFLEVKSTPCMLFFVRGERLRYSRMEDPDPANKVRVMGVKDTLVATGCNCNKWKRIFYNAVVVRNEVLKTYDEEVREQARLARKAARKAARIERRRRQAEEEAEEEEDEDD